MATYLRPTRLDDALAAMAAAPRTVLAGGTDHFPARATFEPPEDIVDITGLPGLRALALEPGQHRIPALATWTDVIQAPLPPLFDGLKTAARQVGGRQIQNVGTLVGNVCNASPAADGVPALLALDAMVELCSLRGRRTLPLAEFILGVRRTARAPDELVTALLVPDRPGRSAFHKLGGRAYLVISISMVAITLEQDEAGHVLRAAVAVGSCGPVASRLVALEAALLGRTPDSVGITAEHVAALSPIDDVRATAAYRRLATLELVRRGLAGFAQPHQRAAA